MTEIRPDSVPTKLREAVERDFQPVRPLSPFWLRTMLAIATLAVVLAFVLANASLRNDLDRLPMWLSWGSSLLQLSLGALLVGLAMRESIPGGGAPRGFVRAAAITAVAVQVLVGIATSVYSPAVAVPGSGLTAGVGCLKHEAMMALPTFVVVLWLVFRALPLRAPVAGLLGGAGATVGADAVIHLLCPMADLAHVLVWHSGAMVIFMAAGWLIGVIWQRLRWRSTS
jgi:hypothetical protein